MAFNKITLNTEVFESKLKLFHKHLSNFIEELDAVCNECGSNDTFKDKSKDDEYMYISKVCRNCGTGECVEKILEP